MTVARVPRFVDTANAALAIQCPRCGLETARFVEFCTSCGYSLWPTGQMATAAFLAWREVDPSRRSARRYDTVLPVMEGPPVMDYDARAHDLGIHLPSGSNWPFVIALGLMIVMIGAAPIATPVRIGCAVVGMVVMLSGVYGWVVVEDVKQFPADVSGGGRPH